MCSYAPPEDVSRAVLPSPARPLGAAQKIRTRLGRRWPAADGVFRRSRELPGEHRGQPGDRAEGTRACGAGQCGARRPVRRRDRRASGGGGAAGAAAGGGGAARGGVRGDGREGCLRDGAGVRRPLGGAHARPPLGVGRAEGRPGRARRRRAGPRGPADRGARGRAGRAGAAAGLGGGGGSRARVSADGGCRVSDKKDTKDKKHAGELKALQAALAAEHAAVYGYGVVGGRIDEKRRTEARSAYDAHRARRDALTREIRDLGGTPAAAAAAYALPFPVPDPAAAVRLAAELEERVAGVYADLVRAAGGELRRSAAGAL